MEVIAFIVICEAGLELTLTELILTKLTFIESALIKSVSVVSDYIESVITAIKLSRIEQAARINGQRD